MSALALGFADAPHPEAPPRPAGARTARDRGSFVVAGPLRLRMPSRPRPAPTRTLTDRLAAEECERRAHIRRWSRMMIVHLERSDFYTPQDSYVATLERLKELLQAEIDTVRACEAPW